MSQKESVKKQEPLFEEEKDFYLSYLNKKMRNSKKKLEQIDELLKKDPETLKPEQLEKVNARDEVLQSVKHFEDLKKLYYTAYKSALEEGKEAKPKSVEKPDQKAKKPTETNILEDAIKKVLELFAFYQVSNSGQETELQQFCNSVLNFTSKSTSTLEERIQQSLQNIQPYIKSEEEKYQNFQQTVQQSIQQFGSVKVEENKNVEVGLPPSAAILQSPLENTQKPPKVVRFVDEVENDLKNEKTQETPVPHQSSSVPEAESNTPLEEEREQSGEEQEQKSFRKRRNYDSQDKPKSRSNNQRYGGNANGHRKNNHEQDTYHRGGRSSNSKYQYYYEKKSAE